MSKPFTWAALLVLSAVLLGCGGGDDAGDGAVVAPAPPPPPAPAAGGNNTVVNNDNNSDTNTETQTGGNTNNANNGGANTTNNNTGTNTNGGGEAITTVAAEGALAAHAKALSIVRPDHYALVKFDLEGARQSQLLKDLPGDPEELAQEIAGGGDAAQAAEMLTGVDLLWVAIGPPTLELVGPDAPPFSFGAYARFQTPEALQEAIDGFGIGENVEAAHSGVKYFRPGKPGGGPVFFSDGVELFASSDEPTIHQIIDAGGELADVPLLAKLKDANLDTHVLVAGSLGPMREPVTGMLSDVIRQANEGGLPLAATTAELPAQIEFGTIAIHLEGDTLIDIDLDMDKPANAAVMKETLSGLLSLGKLILGQQGAQLPDDPAAKEAFGLVMKAINSIKIEQADVHVDVSLAKIEGLEKLSEIVASAQGAASANQSLNNGRNIAIAALNHEAATRKLPQNLKGESGEDVLSWRVAILPFAEERLLYDQFDRKSAWDSEANAEFSQTPIPTYTTPASDGELTTTWKMLPDTPGGILFIEAGVGTAVPWAMPDTFTLNLDDPAASLGEEPEAGYVVVFRDARTMRMTADQIKETVTGEGGEPPLVGNPGPEPSDPVARTWTTADGKNTVEAAFVKLVGDKVTLKRSDTGKEVTLPVNLLSAEDQAYLKSLAE